jgi:hypothetical protein
MLQREPTSASGWAIPAVEHNRIGAGLMAIARGLRPCGSLREPTSTSGWAIPAVQHDRIGAGLMAIARGLRPCGSLRELRWCRFLGPRGSLRRSCDRFKLYRRQIA